MAELEVCQVASPARPRLTAATAPRWIPPPPGFLKFNTDGGVCKAQCKGVSAVVCRDEKGRYQGSSVRVFEAITDPATLEAHAICEALSLAKDIHAQKFYIASDASVVIKEIIEGRASNIDAHSLVKSVLSFQHGRFMWLSKP
ncbi:hypothetical protein BRADI_2g56170v3 [Brachypodium distachyon]|uniref:RNase H type-1 domain-containing protein n=1 Tax=Brachypodium distachyon TaxID=15368 RepID=A0A2K2DG45_BRADI|nr:hypothetical protein BRADI_2g56170v3 [Brachypodium distachyon]